MRLKIGEGTGIGLHMDGRDMSLAIFERCLMISEVILDHCDMLYQR